MLKNINNKKPDFISGFLLFNPITGFDQSVIPDQALSQSTSSQLVEMLRHFLVSSWNDLISWPIQAYLRGMTKGCASFLFLQTDAGNLQSGCYRRHVLTSGTQMCKALQSLGHEIVLVNSNPVPMMTHPDMAHLTYTELRRLV